MLQALCSEGENIHLPTPQPLQKKALKIAKKHRRGEAPSPKAHNVSCFSSLRFAVCRLYAVFQHKSDSITHCSAMTKRQLLHHFVHPFSISAAAPSEFVLHEQP